MHFTRIQALVPMFLCAVGCEKPASVAKNGSDPANGPAGAATLSGQLTLGGGNVADTTVRVEGYPDLSAPVTASGTYTLAVPAATFQGLWLTDGALKLNVYAVNGAGASAFGMQALDVAVTRGKKTEMGTRALEKSGGIQGKATLSAGNDFTGIEIYVPGTIFAARTDAQGSFLLSGLPPGSWPLRIEADGFRPVDTKRLEVASGANTMLDELVLFPSTGVHASLELDSGAAKTKSRTVTARLNYSPNATLMRWSEDPAFTNVRWTPITQQLGHTFTYQFATPGNKVLYASLQDAEGTATTISSNIEVDLFGDDEGLVTLNEGATGSKLRAISIAVTLPENATKMIFCERLDFSGCTWQTAAATASYTFQADGTHLYVKYKDADGFESQVLDVPFVVDTVAPALTVTSHQNGEKFLGESLTLKGSCETGLPVAVTPGTGVSAAASVTCTSGGFTLPLSITGTGAKTVRVSQSDAVGNVTQVDLTLNHTSLARRGALPGAPLSLSESGNTMVSVHGYQGFAVWNKNSATAPVGWVAAGLHFIQAQIVGNYLFVAHDAPTDGIRIYSIGDPATPSSPTLSQTLTASSNVNGFLVHRNLANKDHLYVATDDGVLIWDVSAPTSPVARTAFTPAVQDSPNKISRLFAHGDALAALGDNGKVTVLTLTNVDSSGVTSTVITPPEGQFYRSDYAAAVGDNLYVARAPSSWNAPGGMHHFVLSAPAPGADLANYPCDTNSNTLSWNVIGTSNYLVLTCGYGNTSTIYNITASATGAATSSGNNSGMFAHSSAQAMGPGEYYTVTYGGLSQKINVTATTISSSALPVALVGPKSVSAAGTRMAVSHEYTMSVVDLANPEAPTRAYLASASSTRSAWLGTTPVSLSSGGTLTTLNPAGGVYGTLGSVSSVPYSSLATGTNWAFTSDSSNAALVNLANPASPTVQTFSRTGGGFPTPASAQISDRFIFESTSFGSLYVWEASTSLTSLTQRAQISVCSNSGGKLAVFGNLVYMPCQSEGIKIIDVTTKTAPEVVATLALPSGASSYGVRVQGNYLYTIDSATGFRIYGLHGNPRTPVLVGTSPVALGLGIDSDIDVSNGILMISDRFAVTLFSGLPGL